MNDSAAATSSPAHARGILVEADAQHIVLGIAGTDYQLSLQVYQQPKTEVGKRIAGTIRAQARRIDVVKTGGRYIEPLAGRPRRVQGQVVAIDEGERSVTVHAGVPIVCALDEHQRPSDFEVGHFVSFDVLAGASFTPALKGAHAES